MTNDLLERPAQKGQLAKQGNPKQDDFRKAAFSGPKPTYTNRELLDAISLQGDLFALDTTLGTPPDKFQLEQFNTLKMRANSGELGDLAGYATNLVDRMKRRRAQLEGASMGRIVDD